MRCSLVSPHRRALLGRKDQLLPSLLRETTAPGARRPETGWKAGFTGGRALRRRTDCKADDVLMPPLALPPGSVERAAATFLARLGTGRVRVPSCAVWNLTSQLTTQYAGQSPGMWGPSCSELGAVEAGTAS